MPPAGPRGLADPAAVEARRDLLDLPHVRPLRDFAAALRIAHGAPVPDADPLDGGVEARLLLLLETPGPSVGRTGLVTRDGPTGTAANLFRFLAAAGIARADTLIWNAIPWVIHAPGARNRAPRPAEIRAGHADLPPLLDLLPRLAVIVLAGRAAAAARPVLEALRPGLPLVETAHPSPTYVCTKPTIGPDIVAALARAAGHIPGPRSGPSAL